MKYTVRAGFYLKDIGDANFDNVIDAMDFADFLYDKGFDYIEVVDEERRLQYTVECFAPMTPEEREARRLNSVKFSVEWNHQRLMKRREEMTAKELQDAAYETYKFNISYSRDMDVIMGYFHKRNNEFPSVPQVLEVFHGV